MSRHKLWSRTLYPQQISITSVSFPVRLHIHCTGHADGAKTSERRPQVLLYLLLDLDLDLSPWLTFGFGFVNGCPPPLTVDRAVVSAQNNPHPKGNIYRVHFPSHTSILRPATLPFSSPHSILTTQGSLQDPFPSHLGGKYHHWETAY
ncbi:hypothetical protein HD806DRAFT_459792 [Xylariaceae sp. AK1471]|nr:hypothetical protein HD806DRAFT_459792 [Xylariaceae sp. AK1471]